MPPGVAVGALLYLWKRGRTRKHPTLGIGVCPPHKRRSRRVTEGGNGHVGPTWRESWGGLGGDRVRGCSHGLGYGKPVKRSTGQTPSGESQRARPGGHLCQG